MVDHFLSHGIAIPEAISHDYQREIAKAPPTPELGYFLCFSYHEDEKRDCPLVATLRQKFDNRKYRSHREQATWHARLTYDQVCGNKSCAPYRYRMLCYRLRKLAFFGKLTLMSDHQMDMTHRILDSLTRRSSLSRVNIWVSTVPSLTSCRLKSSRRYGAVVLTP